MKKLIPLFSFAFVLFGLHLVLVFFFLKGQSLSFILGTHTFLFFFLFVGNLAMRKVKSIDPKKVGMTFLTVTVFKMLSSIVFIFVIKQNSSLDKNEIIFNFFGVFFLYLIYEVFTAIKELK
jgi:hypothetical protein|tara:strand:+ start:251 stop:613 length:363 start_codon:yes stop_codon:yes gene_type:complete